MGVDREKKMVSTRSRSRKVRNSLKGLAVAITGIFGAGKSTVAGILKEMSIPVVNCDRLAHEILQKPEITEKIRQRFGQEVFNSAGKIDRRRLAAVVFRDKDKRKYLEKIVHPLVFSRLQKKMLDYRKSGSKIVAAEIPLLFETKAEKLFDYVIAVYAHPEVIKQRLKGKFTTDQILRRWKSQWSQEKKKNKADFTVNNSRGISYTRSQVETIIRKWYQLLKFRNHH